MYIFVKNVAEPILAKIIDFVIKIIEQLSD